MIKPIRYTIAFLILLSHLAIAQSGILVIDGVTTSGGVPGPQGEVGPQGPPGVDAVNQGDVYTSSNNTYSAGTTQAFANATVTNTANAEIDVVNLLTMTNYARSGWGNIINATNDYTLTANDYTVLANGSNSAVTLSLPSPNAVGKLYNIKCIEDSNTVLVNPNESSIDGATNNFQLIKHESITIQSDGLNWWIL